VIANGVGRVIILAAGGATPIQSAVRGSKAYGTTLHS